MPALKHTHYYQRLGSRERSRSWHCMHPDCTHKIPTDEVLGKRSTCTCGETFILDTAALQRKTPKCLNCRDTIEGRQHQRVVSVLDSVFEHDITNAREELDALRSINSPTQKAMGGTNE